MATRRRIKLDAVAEAQLAALAEEAEIGYAPEQVRSPRRGRPQTGDGLPRVIQFRVEDALFEELLERARQEDTGISAIARQALASYLHAEPQPLSQAADEAALALVSGGSQALSLGEYIAQAYKGRDFAALADAPVDALEGLSKGDAEALQKAFNIKTIRQLAESKFVLRAQAVVRDALRQRGDSETGTRQESRFGSTVTAPNARRST
jgi:predicted transcriptional regulator